MESQTPIFDLYLTEIELEGLGLCLEQCNEFGIVLVSGSAFSYFEIHAAGLHVGQSEASLTYRKAAEVTCVDAFTISIGKLNPDTFASCEFEAKLDTAMG